MLKGFGGTDKLADIVVAADMEPVHSHNRNLAAGNCRSTTVAGTFV